MNYKAAFRCKKCPQSNGPEGCPVWIEIVIVNSETKHTAIDKNCGFQLMPLLMVEVIKASNRPAEEMSALREGMTMQYRQLVHETTKRAQKILDLPDPP